MAKYYKIRKEIAKRGGFNAIIRTEVEEDYLLLSEKDMKMIDLTVSEKVEAFGADEYVAPRKNKK